MILRDEGAENQFSEPEPSGTELSELAKAGRGSDRKRLIRRMSARNELQENGGSIPGRE